MRQHIALDASIDSLEALRNTVASVARRAGATEVVVGAISLAVDEAVTNVILHGYGSHHGPIELTAEVEAGEIVVRVADRAPLFDPLAAPAPDMHTPVESRRIGGFGVYLIKRNVDSFEHAGRPGGGNILTMRRRIAEQMSVGAET